MAAEDLLDEIADPQLAWEAQPVRTAIDACLGPTGVAELIGLFFARAEAGAVEEAPRSRSLASEQAAPQQAELRL